VSGEGSQAPPGFEARGRIPPWGRREKMKIQLSEKKIADAILHNNETTVTGGDRMSLSGRTAPRRSA